MLSSRYKSMLTIAYTALLITTVRFNVFGQQNTPAIPLRIALPWKVINYSQTFVIENKNAFEIANNSWRQEWLRQESPLLSDPQISGNQQLSLNLRQRLENISYGDGANPDLGKTALTAQPIICPLGDHTLIAVSFINSQQEYLISLGHSIIPTKALLRAQSPDEQPQLAQLLSEMLVEAGKRAAENAQAQRPLQDALQINFRNARKITRQDYGSALCLNLLISESLAKDGYQLIPSIGLEDLKSIKRAYRYTQKNLRATRSFKMEWSFPMEPYPAKTSFPLNLLLKIGYAEAVFASSINTKLTETLTIRFSIAPNRLVTHQVPKQLLEVLAQEEQALQYQDKPQISAINRAWVYVDRGRGWGLKMSDRLVVGNDNQIKGHVVGFFGPELGLRSPRGYPIHEGAIIFIRKGQAEVRIGQEFDYDQQTYPSPWPPPEKG